MDKFGGITVEEAADAIILYSKTLNGDPYFKFFILPAMEERIKYSESMWGKLFPYSPLDRIRREIFIMKIAFCMCITGIVFALIVQF